MHYMPDPGLDVYAQCLIIFGFTDPKTADAMR